MSNMKVTGEELTAAGYRRSINNPLFNRADWLWQKRVRSDKGDTLYFINIYQYLDLYRDNGGGDGWMPTAQLYLDADHTKHIDLTLGGFMDLLSAEAFIQSAYYALNCSPDERSYELSTDADAAPNTSALAPRVDEDTAASTSVSDE